MGWGYEIRGDLRERDASRPTMRTIATRVRASAARLLPVLRVLATKLKRNASLAISRAGNTVAHAGRSTAELAPKPVLLQNASDRNGEDLDLAVLRLAASAQESARGFNHPDVASELHLSGALDQIRADLRARDTSRPGDPRRMMRTIPIRVRASAAHLANTLMHAGRSTTDRARSLRARPRERTADPTPIATASAELAPKPVLLSDRNGQDIDLALLRLAARESARGFNHPDVASELHLLGALYHDARRYNEAIAFYATALVIRQRTLGRDHSEVASTLVDLEAARRDEANEEKRAGIASRETGPERAEVGA